jgi:uncharacterized protein YndB with AHSA1/START domain
MRLKARTSAPLKEVHQALTDAAALRAWLAEDAEVELPGRYAFWGRYTPDGGEAHQRPLHVDERTVRFAWRLDGVDTTVEFGLEERPEGGTLISLSQTDMVSWEEAIAETSVRSVLHTYWALSVANLVDHVEGRPLTAKADFTSPVMREELFIDAPRAEVYASLMEPEQFARWFGAKVDIEPRVGGRFAMGGFEFDQNPAKIVDLEPGRRMSMAWGEMVSGWELEDAGGRTKLTFVQSGFDTAQPPYGSWAGWLGGIAELRRYHELPDWRPIWLTVETPGVPQDMLTIGNE